MKILFNIYLYFIFIFDVRKIVGSLLSRLKNRYQYIPDENNIELFTEDLYGFEFTNRLTTSTKQSYKSISSPYEDLYYISTHKESQEGMDKFEILQYSRNTVPNSYKMLYKSRGKTFDDLFITRPTIGWSQKTIFSTILKPRKTFPTYFPIINLEKMKSEVVEDQNTANYIRRIPSRTKVITIKPRFSLNLIYKPKNSTKNQPSTNSTAFKLRTANTTITMNRLTSTDYLTNTPVTINELTTTDYLTNTPVIMNELTTTDYLTNTPVTMNKLTTTEYQTNTPVTMNELTTTDYQTNTPVTMIELTTTDYLTNTPVTMNELTTTDYLTNTPVTMNELTTTDYLTNTPVTMNELNTTDFLTDTPVTMNGLTTMDYPDYTTTTMLKQPYEGRRASCYYCGLNFTGLSMPLCHKIFDDGDQRFRKRHHFLKIKCFWDNETYQQKNRYYSPDYRGGCFKRFLDVGTPYNERGCRKKKPETGKSYASKRFAKLEMLLDKVEDGCTVSPHASLTPFSRPISLYVRYHVCVCSTRYCNHSSNVTISSLQVLLLSLVLVNRVM